MSEKSKRTDKNARESNQRTSEGTVPEIFRDNPTLVLTLLYLYATWIGIVYALGLYGSFGINIFDYAEITDFLLAAFKNGWVLVNLAIQVVVVLATLTIGWLSQTARWALWRRPGRLTVIVIVYIFVASRITYDSAIGVASSIKEGEAPTVDVRYRSFSGSAGQVKEPDLVIIGATQKAAFFYAENKKHTLVIPRAQIVSIEVPEPGKVR